MFPFQSPSYDDRDHAGKVLAGRLAHLAGPDTLVLAIPNGGVAVALPVARVLGAPLRLMVVRKILIPGSTEAGFGAVAADGSRVVDELMIRSLGLSPAQVEHQAEAALTSIRERLELYGDWARLPEIKGRAVILVDDGLATGSTMAAALKLIKAKIPRLLIAAAPTASPRALDLLQPLADEVAAPHVGGRGSFAVASAYRRWYDVEPEEVMRELTRWEKEQVTSGRR